MNSFFSQTRPSTTNATELLSVHPSNGEKIEINSIWITPTSGSATTFSLFIDKGVSTIADKTYDENNALFFEVDLEDGQPVHLSGERMIVMTNAKTILVAQVGNASAVTFTIFGDRT